jgi:hypothetical protein
VFETDWPNAVPVEVAHDDTVVACSVLETEISSQVLAGHHVARDVTDDDAQTLRQEEVHKRMNEVRIGGQRPFGWGLLEEVGLDEDGIPRDKTCAEEGLLTVEDLSQPGFIVVIDPFDSCLHVSPCCLSTG